MKEENKRSAETQLKQWINRMTIDHLVLSDDMTEVTEIDSQPVDSYNMVYLRALCIKLKVNGYKNKRRDDMLQLLCYRKRIQMVESVHYPESSDEEETPNDDGNNQQLENESSAANNHNIASPETRSMARARRLQAEEEANQNKKEMETKQRNRSSIATIVTNVTTHDDNKSDSASNPHSIATRATYSKKVPRIGKSTAPSFVTTDGTYYRAINVWFDERSRTDIVNMGESPTMQELDSRQFANKRTYDKLLVTYLDTSVENDAISYIGFGGDAYMLSCGIGEDHASNFDVLTSEELKQVLDHVVYWYNISLRNNKASGNHADFHQFVGCRPFVYYYHLWLLEIPHLSFLAVPALDETVFRSSINDDADLASATTPSEISNATKSQGVARGRTNYKRKGHKNDLQAHQKEEETTKKLKLFENHLKTMEDIENKRLVQTMQQSKLEELKAVEEMIKMKTAEVIDSKERQIVERQLRKLRKKRDQLYESICDDSDSDSSSTDTESDNKGDEC